MVCVRYANEEEEDSEVRHEYGYFARSEEVDECVRCYADAEGCGCTYHRLFGAYPSDGCLDHEQVVQHLDHAKEAKEDPKLLLAHVEGKGPRSDVVGGNVRVD